MFKWLEIVPLLMTEHSLINYIATIQSTAFWILDTYKAMSMEEVQQAFFSEMILPT